MQEHFRARWRRRAAVLAAAALVVLVFSACETDPATDVTSTAATLNGKGRCYNGLSGWWRYQLRDASAGGSFFGVGPQHPFACSADTGYVAFQAERIGGLTPGRTYQFRIRTELNGGEPFWTDSAGTKNGSNYDSFRTPAIQINYQSGNIWNFDESNDPGIPNPHGDETQAEASAVKRCKGRFNPLQNLKFFGIFMPPVYSDRLYEAGNLSKWCWYSGGRIYFRDHWHVNRVLSRLGGVFLDQVPFSSGCSSDRRNCLYRSELQASIGIKPPDPIPDIVKRNFHCIGTRIYAGNIGPNGDPHSRAIHDTTCSNAVGSVARADADGDATQIEVGGARVSPATERALNGACFTRRNLTHYKKTRQVLPGCTRAARHAYNQARR